MFIFSALILFSVRSIAASDIEQCASETFLVKAQFRASCEEGASWMDCGLLQAGQVVGAKTLVGTAVVGGVEAAKVKNLEKTIDSQQVDLGGKIGKQLEAMKSELQRLGVDPKLVDSYISQQLHVATLSQKINLSTDRQEIKNLTSERDVARLEIKKIKTNMMNARIKEMGPNMAKGAVSALVVSVAAREIMSDATVKKCVQPGIGEDFSVLKEYVTVKSGLINCDTMVTSAKIDQLIAMSNAQRVNLFKKNPSLCRVLSEQQKKSFKLEQFAQSAKIDHVTCENDGEIRFQMKIDGQTFTPSIKKSSKGLIDLDSQFFGAGVVKDDSRRSFSVGINGSTGEPQELTTTYPSMDFSNQSGPSGEAIAPLDMYRMNFQAGTCRNPEPSLERNSFYGNKQFELGCMVAKQVEVIKYHLSDLIAQCSTGSGTTSGPASAPAAKGSK
jgi:hypothetical protein